MGGRSVHQRKRAPLCGDCQLNALDAAVDGPGSLWHGCGMLGTDGLRTARWV
jgi:hypothetical protein